MTTLNPPWFVDAKSGVTAHYSKQTHISTYLGQYKNACLNHYKNRYQKFCPERLPQASLYYPMQFPRVPVHTWKSNGWVSVHCCFHEDKSPSLRIHCLSGAFRCFGCGAKGGDVLSFQQLRYGMTFFEAVSFFHAWGDK